MSNQPEVEKSVTYMSYAQNELVLYTVLIRLAEEALKRSYQNYLSAFASGEDNLLRQRLRTKLVSAYWGLRINTEALCDSVNEGVIQAMVAAAPIMQRGDNAVIMSIIAALEKYEED